MTAAPLSCDFGDVPIVRFPPADSADALRFFVEAPITITNHDPDPVQLGTVSIDTPGPFTIAGDGCSGTALAPGASCEVVVRFLAEKPGGYAAALLVELASGESAPILVPLSGDAVEVACEGSTCEAPAFDFGAACAGDARQRVLGFRNDTGSPVLAMTRLEIEGVAILADLPPERTVAPGEEYAATMTAHYNGDAGAQEGQLIWSVPPPTLPVVREVVMPVTLRVRECFPEIHAVDIAGRRGEIFEARPRYATRRKRYIVEDRLQSDGTLAGRVAVLGRREKGPVVAVTRVRRQADAVQIAPWRLLALDPDDATHGLLALRESPPVILSGEGDPVQAVKAIDKASPLLWLYAVGRKKGYRLDYQTGTVIENDLGLSARESSVGPLSPGVLQADHAYAIVRREGLVAGRPASLAVARLGLTERPRGSEGDDDLRLRLTVRRKTRLAEIAGRKAIAVRAMDTVAVRRKKNLASVWDETLVLAARYRKAAGETPVRYLLLRGGGGGGMEPNATRTGWGWRRSAEVPPLVALRARRLAAENAPFWLPPWDTQPTSLILARLAFEDGTIAQHVARRQAGGTWSWALGRRLSVPHDIVAMRRRKRMADVTELIVVGQRMMSRLRIRKGRATVLARKSVPAQETILGLARPRYAELRARKKRYSFVLQKPGDRASPRLALHRLQEPPAVLLGAHGLPPVVLSGGDAIVRPLPEPGAAGTEVALTAYAYDPEGDQLYWSWLAPGVELDDPTSPNPTGFFPVGETLVYVVVRDGPPDDQTAGESAPAIIHVIVEESTGCEDSYFDVNGDGTLDISDAVYELAYLFASGPAPVRPEAADLNGDGGTDISDPIYLLLYLFAGGPAPVCPQ